MSDISAETCDSLAESLRRVEALIPPAATSSGPRPAPWTRLSSLLAGWVGRRRRRIPPRSGVAAQNRDVPPSAGDPGCVSRNAAISCSAPDSASSESLRRTVLDDAVPSQERRSALAQLSERLRGEPEYSTIVMTLIDDRDADLVVDAIASAPPFDAKVIARLRELLDDPRPEIWRAAASSLARKKDHATLPRMLAWARRGDAAHRCAGLAAVAFLLIPQQHLAVVESICEDGPRDDDDEAVLVNALRIAESRVAFWRKATGEAAD